MSVVAKTKLCVMDARGQCAVDRTGAQCTTLVFSYKLMFLILIFLTCLLERQELSHPVDHAPFLAH